MSNLVGEAQVAINLDFLARALTRQGLEEESLTLNQHFIIKRIDASDPELIVLDCEIYEEYLN
ncbi:MAG TPA: hypothetical protein PLS50_00585 [Candidatus Dojkabacteria bacterium]|nr:hypothetical protein [Candidatus Dojkabacteria bacterium]